VKWAKKQIENEGEKSWNKHNYLLPKKRKMNKVNLLMDSNDFRLSIKSSISRSGVKNLMHQVSNFNFFVMLVAKFGDCGKDAIQRYMMGIGWRSWQMIWEISLKELMS
jgi:hypothetical protein